MKGATLLLPPPSTPPIDPIALQIGPFAVRWYAVLMLSSLALGIWIARRETRRLGLDPDVWLDAATPIFLAAIAGARLYEVFVLQWPYYRAHPGEIVAIWRGGLSIHGGVIGGVLAGLLFARARRLPFAKWFDIAAPGIIAGQALGRWGNFINQEAHGGPAPDWVMRLLPGFIRDQMYIGGVYVHPTFLYESIWNLGVLAVLLRLRRLRPRRGVVAAAYVALYSVGRFAIESIRTDSTFLPGGWRVAQVASLALIAGALVYIWFVSATPGPRYGEG